MTDQSDTSSPTAAVRPASSPASSSSSSSCRSTAFSIRAIMREYDEIRSNRNPYWTAAPIMEDEPYEWHFTVRGPTGTEFEGGMYHGKLVLPQNYPLAPPSFTLLNQNGRFEVGRKVCLSASNYHPELWQPAWGIRTMLNALHAFFATPADGAVHSLNWPEEVRRKLAEESPSWKCPVCKNTNATLMAKYCEDPTPMSPVLPSSMIPSSVALTVPYLRRVPVTGDSAVVDEEGKDTTDQDQAITTQQLTSVSGEVTISNPPQTEGETAQQTEAQRRRLRISNQPTHHTTLTFKEFFRIFFILPVKILMAYLCDPTVRIAEKSIFLIDIVSVLLVLSTGYLIADIVLRPGSLSTVLLIEAE